MASVADKLYTFVKNQYNNATPQMISHDRAVDDEAALKMAHAKKKWLLDYQEEREKKMVYVKQHLLAQNLEIGKL